MLIFLHFVAAAVWAVLGGVPAALVGYILGGPAAAIAGGALMGAIGVMHDITIRPNWADALYESWRTAIARRRRRREYQARQRAREQRETRRNAAALTLLAFALLLASAGAIAIPGNRARRYPDCPDPETGSSRVHNPLRLQQSATSRVRLRARMSSLFRAGNPTRFTWKPLPFFVQRLRNGIPF